MNPLSLVLYLVLAFLVLFGVIICVRAWVICAIFNSIVDRIKEELRNGKKI